MGLTKEQLDALLLSPREHLGLEIKQWLDPSADEGKAKIAIACMALRNNNGGHLIIGFNDDGTPDLRNAPTDVQGSFHIDKIQSIVGRFSSERFAIEVQLGQRDRALYPVISVPPGARSVVAAKSGLVIGSKSLIEDHAVYVRSLSSNNTVSSSKARRDDWDRLIEICIDNREADVGRFVRRHLSALNLERLQFVLSSVTDAPRPLALDRSRTILDDGYGRFVTALRQQGIDLPPAGFREAAVVIDGDVPLHAATESFLQRLFAAQPHHTGWPAWFDARHSASERDHPYTFDGGWQALLVELKEAPFRAPHLEFWRIDPSGMFYQLTALEDDLPVPAPRPQQPRTELDFLLQICRVAEIISVALAFARAMDCEAARTSLAFAFRWRGLKNRRVTSWADSRRTVRSPALSMQDEVVTTLTVPLDTPRSAIGSHVVTAVRNLFALFGGMEFENRVIEQIADEALQTRF